MLRSRKGISLVEVIIALVIISIITVSTLSMIMIAVNVEAKSVRTIEIAESLDNTIDCFLFAQNEEEFLAALKKTAGFYKSGGHFYYGTASYTVMISADFTANSFTYTAKDTDGKTLYSFDFQDPWTPEGGTAE